MSGDNNKAGDYNQSIKYFRYDDKPLWKIQNKGLHFNSKQLTPTNAIDTYFPQNIAVNGSVTAKQYDLLSDIHLKKNVQEISLEDIQRLKLLSPITFQYKTDTTKTHYGFVAQEVEKIYPQLVSTQKYKMVNSMELIPIMIAKINQLEEKIVKLEEEIKDKREKVEKVEKVKEEKE